MKTKAIIAVLLLCAVLACGCTSSENLDSTESGIENSNVQGSELSENAVTEEIDSAWLDESDEIEIGEMI